MWFNRLVLSDDDYEKLMAAIDRARDTRSLYLPHLDLFQAQVRRATVVPPQEVPSDLVTMHSEFMLTGPEDGEVCVYTLVYPDEHLVGGVSVLSAMGRAVLGARVGHEVCWLSSAGPEVARVLRLLQQPEWRATCGVGLAATGSGAGAW